MRQERSRKLFLIAFSFVFALFVAEVALVAIDPHLPLGLYEYDEDIGFKVRAEAKVPREFVTSGDDRTNRFGFNDFDYPLERQDGVPRIVVLGDSFQWVGGIRGNYTHMIEERFLRLLPGRKVEVINAGYPMTSTREELAVLEKFGLAYQPDMVLLGITVGNDFLEAHPFRKRIVVNGIYLDVDSRSLFEIAGRPIVARSRVALLAKQRAMMLLESWRAGHTAEPGEGGRLSEDVYMESERKRLEFCRIADLAAGRRDAQIGVVLGSLARMRSRLAEQGVRFMAALYPDELQVDDLVLAAVLGRYGLTASDYEIGCYQRILAGFLEEQRIPFVDLLPVSRRETKNGSLFLPMNIHWNERGNALAARELHAALMREAGELFSGGVAQ